MEDTCNVDGLKMWNLAKRIYPICRSITGDGVRQTLAILSEYVPEMKILEVPSGTQVYDWIVPKEWNIKDGGIWYEDGTEVISFKKHNLHVMGYSTPIDRWVDLDELLSLIYVQEDQDDVIPYVTSYYNECYGFCMSKKQKDSLKPGNYHIMIDSSLTNGFMTYAEVILPGKIKEEIFFSTYICHPSMGNNECSGPALAVYLINWIKGLTYRHYTYRFIFIPETIGSITYLSKNLTYLKKHVIAGFNLSCVGDDRTYSVIESRYGNTLADKVLKNVLKYRNKEFKIYPYLMRGSDERQYNAPGIDLPVVAFCRSKYSEYKEYHTSADDMNLISAKGFQGSFEVMSQCIMSLENNKYYKVTVFCEPQLGKRQLYPTVSKKGCYHSVKCITNFLAYADGNNDLIDISNRIEVSSIECIKIVEQLLDYTLIEEVSSNNRKKRGPYNYGN